MDKVNIVTVTTAKGPRKQEAVGMWLIEYINEKGTQTKQDFLYRESITANELTLQLMANAVFILSKANIEYESVTVYMDCPNIASAFMNKWIDKWIENDWKKATGDEIANSETWKMLYQLMSVCSKQFIVTDYRSRYTDWMNHEAEKHIEVIKAKEELKRKLTKGEENNVIS